MFFSSVYGYRSLIVMAAIDNLRESEKATAVPR
jgi:hypothetical protein